MDRKKRDDDRIKVGSQIAELEETQRSFDRRLILLEKQVEVLGARRKRKQR